MLRLFVLSLVGLFIVQSLNTQVPDTPEALSLESLIGEALENNPGIASSRYREEAAAHRIGQMRAWLPPVFTYRYNPQPFGATGEVDFMNMHIYSLSQTIPFPGKISPRVDMERANYRMSSFDRRNQEVQLAAKVKETYYELWMIQKKSEVNNDLRALFESFLLSAERMFEVGMTGMETVLSVQTNLAKLRTEERALKNDYDKKLSTINQLLDRDPGTAFGTIVSLPAETIPYDIPALEARTLRNRPDIQSIRSAIEMNRAEISSARREYYPDIMVGLMYMQMPGGMKDRFGVEVSMQIPLAPWSGNKLKERVGETQREMLSREKALENLTSEVRSEIRRAILDLETQRDIISLYRDELIPNAEETAESALGAFRTGTTEYITVLDSFRMLETFRMEYYTAQATFHKRVAELERQAGILM